MQVENWKIENVHEYPNNPRKNNDAVEYVANSIKEFGFRSPIIVDKDGVIICGHTRLKAALSLGLTEVPVHVADNLTDEQVKAYRLADNKTGELSTWDWEQLNAELEDIDWLDIDMQQFGFKLDDELAPPSASDVGYGENGYEYHEQYAVTVICENEREQEKVYGRLTKEGYNCRVVVV